MVSTPGPWKEHQDCIIPVIPAAGSPNDNHVILMGGVFCGPDAFYNKRLIIAAPDLLAAAIELRQAFLDGCGAAPPGTKKRRRLMLAGRAMEAAIHKAGGAA